MSKTVDYVVAFVAGLAAGVLSTQKYWKGYYRQQAEDEIDSVKNALFKRKDDKKVVTGKEEAPKNDNLKPNSERTLVDFGYSDPSKVSQATDYNKFYEPEEETVIEHTNLEVEMAKNEAPSEETKPFLISEEDYTETMDSYDKMTCTFYVPDRIVVDDLSREVIEPDVIGEDNIEFLIKTNLEMVYIRNDNISCDMEISKSHDSVVETGDVVWR